MNITHGKFSGAHFLITASIIALLAMGTMASVSAMGGNGNGKGEGRGQGYGQQQEQQVYQRIGILSAFEKEALGQMGEEEFLARDVYLELEKKWDMKIFSNISKSEQRHADKIIDLTNAYGVENFSHHEAGVFENQDLQKVYDDLIAKGFQSETDALIVGAIIEDLDIYDLEKFLLNVENADVKKVFDTLNRGSRNHMRAFTRQLDEKGEKYTTQYITENRYQEILSGDHEKGSDHRDGADENYDGSVHGKKGEFENKGNKGNSRNNQPEEQGFWAWIWNLIW